MSARSKLTLTLIAFTVLLVISLAGLYLYRTVTNLSQQFRERTELLALAFADRAALYLAQNQQKDLELLAQTVVLGSVLYAQIVSEGRVIAQNTAIAIELPIERFSTPLHVERRRLSSGTVYLDITRPLTLPNTQSTQYVRLGINLEPLSTAIRAQVLMVAGVSLSFILVAVLLALYVSRVFFSTRRPLAASVGPPQAAATASTAQVASAARTLGELLIDDTSKRVHVRGQPVELSPKEYELLKLLASTPGRVFPNQEILERVWPQGGFATAQDVKQYVYFLRQKIEENPEEPKLIVTVRGFGYKLQI